MEGGDVEAEEGAPHLVEVVAEERCQPGAVDDGAFVVVVVVDGCVGMGIRLEMRRGKGGRLGVLGALLNVPGRVRGR